MGKSSTKEDAAHIVKSQRAVGDHFGVAANTVKEWIGQRGCPGERQRYDLKAIEEWILGTMRQQDYPPKLRHLATNESQVRKARADALIKETEAEIKLLELEKKRNTNLVDVHDLNAWVSDFLTNFRKVLKRLGPQMVNAYPPAIRQQLLQDIDERTDMILEVGAAYGERTADLLGD